MATKSGDQGLRDWFGKSKSSDGKPGWVQLGGKYAGKPCARQPGQTSTPKCGSSKMKRNLNAKEEERARRRKNRQDPNQPEKSGGAKPTNVRTEGMDIQEVKDKPGKGSGKKDACYHKVKSRYSVWPSAYASGALVKCRKVGASNWGNKSESYEFSNWRDDFQPTEYEFFDVIKAEPIKGGQSVDEKCWDGYTQKGMKKKGKKVVPNCVRKEGYAPGDVDQKVGAVTSIPKDERDAARERLLAKAKAKREKMKEEKEETNIGGGNLKKLTKKAVKRIDYDVDGDVDPDDKVEKKTGNYGEELPTPFGKFRTKIKNEEFSDWRTELDEGVMPATIDPKAHRKQQRAAKIRNLAQKGATEGERAAAEKKTEGPKMFGEDWQKVNRKDKTDGMSQKAVDAYRRENPGSKLQTAVTEKNPTGKRKDRRNDYCDRSDGQRKMHNIDCSKTPKKKICKARRRWRC